MAPMNSANIVLLALLSANGVSAWGWQFTWPTAWPWPHPTVPSVPFTWPAYTSTSTSAPAYTSLSLTSALPTSTLFTSIIISSSTPAPSSSTPTPTPTPSSSTPTPTPSSSTPSPTPSSSTPSPTPSSSTPTPTPSSSTPTPTPSSSTPTPSSSTPTPTPSSSTPTPTPSSSTTVVAPVSSSSSATPSGACPTGVHIIVARGSLEQQGEGNMASLANNITARIPGSDSEALVYPAVLFPYFDSEGSGVTNMTALLMSYHAQCPNTKLVLIGWSQGGQVIMDTLCGTSEIDFNATAPIDQTYTANMIAAIAYGDPSFHLDQPYDVGTATRNGIFNRTDLAACAPYYTRIQSYCDDNDTYCTNYNSSGLATHFAYFDKYNFAATDFVVSKYSA